MRCQVFTTATNANYTSAEKYISTARTVGISHAITLCQPDGNIKDIRLQASENCWLLATIKRCCRVATAGMLLAPDIDGGRLLARFMMAGPLCLL